MYYILAEIFAFYIFNKTFYPGIPVGVFPCALLSELLLVRVEHTEKLQLEYTDKKCYCISIFFMEDPVNPSLDIVLHLVWLEISLFLSLLLLYIHIGLCWNNR